jgi:acyl-CoA thioester hydrolase
MKEQKLFNFFQTTPIQIRFNDIDQLGHVNNSVYQQYFDLGRTTYFDEVFKEKMDWDEEGLILASINIDFISSITLYDKVIVRTKIYHIGNKSLKMVQDLFDESTGLVVAATKSILVAYNFKKLSTVKVPQRWKEKILVFEHDMLFEV